MSRGRCSHLCQCLGTERQQLLQVEGGAAELPQQASAGSDLRASHQGRAGAWLTRRKRPGFREDEPLGILFITEAKF